MLTTNALFQSIFTKFIIIIIFRKGFKSILFSKTLCYQFIFKINHVLWKYSKKGFFQEISMRPIFHYVDA